MKSKAPLPLMEQLIMILVFALTAALCLQGFSLASHMSHRQEARQEAVILAQNTAECLKSHHSDYEAIAQQLDGQWDGNHLILFSQNDLKLQVIPAKTDSPYLGSAHIQVSNPQDLLFELTIAWQEVNAHDLP